MAIWFPYLIANQFVEYPGGLQCVGVWTGFFEVSSSFENNMLGITPSFFYTPLVLVGILCTIIYVKLK